MQGQVTMSVCHRTSQLRCLPFRACANRSSQQGRTALVRVRAAVNQATQLPKLQPLDSSYEEWHTFRPYANWLVPGHVMLGRYPFVERSRCHSREQGEEQLAEILGVGISAFVCLQDELPPQEQLTLAGKKGFLPYKATADLIQAAINGPPQEIEALHSLRTPALDKFLPKAKKQAVARKELQYLHSPIVDLGLPNMAALETLLADLQRRLEAGEKLYIHCWGGRGRAGTVGACLLHSAYGTGLEEALERVQRGYDTRGDVERSKSPETSEQFEFVRQFAKMRGSM